MNLNIREIQWDECTKTLTKFNIEKFESRFQNHTLKWLIIWTAYECSDIVQHWDLQIKSTSMMKDFDIKTILLRVCRNQLSELDKYCLTALTSHHLRVDKCPQTVDICSQFWMMWKRWCETRQSLPDRVRQSRVNLNFHCVSKNEIKRLRKR